MKGIFPVILFIMVFANAKVSECIDKDTWEVFGDDLNTSFH